MPAFRLANAESTWLQKKKERAYVGNARRNLNVCACSTLVLKVCPGNNPEVKKFIETIEILCETFTAFLRSSR